MLYTGPFRQDFTPARPRVIDWADRAERVLDAHPGDPAEDLRLVEAAITGHPVTNKARLAILMRAPVFEGQYRMDGQHALVAAVRARAAVLV